MPAEQLAQSRRSVLGAIAAAGVAGLAAVIGRAAPVAAEGQTVRVGEEYTDATSLTRIKNSTNAQDVFKAESAGSGRALVGSSVEGHGVHGSSNGDGKAGVAGVTSDANGYGVFGQHNGSGSTGFLGLNGTGVYGSGHSHGVRAWTDTGEGVSTQAEATGLALRTQGRLRFGRRSGVATIAPGTTSVVVSLADQVTTGTFVLLTPRSRLFGRDLWYTTNAAGGTITIRVSQAGAAALKVGWLVLEG